MVVMSALKIDTKSVDTKSVWKEGDGNTGKDKKRKRNMTEKFSCRNGECGGKLTKMKEFMYINDNMTKNAKPC